MNDVMTLPLQPVDEVKAETCSSLPPLSSYYTFQCQFAILYEEFSTSTSLSHLQDLFNTILYQFQLLDTILTQLHRIPGFPLECPETHKFVDLGPPPACNQR
jgi:hypothetical protein